MQRRNRPVAKFRGDFGDTLRTAKDKKAPTNPFAGAFLPSQTKGAEGVHSVSAVFGAP